MHKAHSHTMTLGELIHRAQTGRISRYRCIHIDGMKYKGSLSRIYQRPDGLIQIDVENVQEMPRRFAMWLKAEDKHFVIGNQHKVLLGQDGKISIDMPHIGIVELSQNHRARSEERREELEHAFA